MDIDKLVDEVLRRLMILIEQEKAPATGAAPDAVTGATTTLPCSAKAAAKKALITEAEALGALPGSTVSYPKGTLVTPLAKDAFRQRKVTVLFE